MLRASAAALIILVSILVVPASGVRYTASLDYPPLSYPPMDVVVDDMGRVWFALPLERAVALYIPDVGVNLINLGFKASNLVYGHGLIVAYDVGSSEVAFLDASSARVVWESVEAGILNSIVVVDGGFVFVKNFPTMTLLTHVSPSGDILWESSISDRQVERFKGAAGSDRYVWLKTVDNNLLLVEVGRGGYKEFRLGRSIVALASRDGKVWAVDSDGGVTRLSPGGVEASLRTEIGFRPGDIVFALPGDRLVILTMIDAFLTEVVGARVSREPLQYSFNLAALKGVSEIYLIDSSRKEIIIASISRPPVISDVSASLVDDGRKVLVRARVSDPDDDMAEGFPRALGTLDGRAFSQQMSLQGGVYVAELEVPQGDGVLRIYVQAADRGGNEVSLQAAALQVSSGKATSLSTSTTTQSPTVEAPQDLTSLFPLAAELVLFAVLVSALTVIWLTRSRRGRRRKR